MRRKIKTNTFGLLIALLLLMTFSGCRVRRPDDVLSPRKMEAVLYDYHLAQAIVTELPPQSDMPETHTFIGVSARTE